MVAAIHSFIAELKGNPAEIRNYPRSCKSHDAQCVIPFLKIQATVAPLAAWEGFRKRESQKTCRNHNHKKF